MTYSYFLFTLQIERSTGAILGGAQSPILEFEKTSCRIMSHSFVYKKTFSDYYIDGKEFHKEAKAAMHKEMLDGLPDYVANVPLCPLEKMVETPCFESIDDLPLF